MIIPLWVDEKKDKKLVDWLNTFTNRSAAIRLFLYDRMSGNTKCEHVVEEKLDNDFISSLDSFDLGDE